jgi:hypothetical protein
VSARLVGLARTSRSLVGLYGWRLSKPPEGVLPLLIKLSQNLLLLSIIGSTWPLVVGLAQLQGFKDRVWSTQHRPPRPAPSTYSVSRDEVVGLEDGNNLIGDTADHGHETVATITAYGFFVGDPVELGLTHCAISPARSS